MDCSALTTRDAPPCSQCNGQDFSHLVEVAASTGLHGRTLDMPIDGLLRHEHGRASILIHRDVVSASDQSSSVCSTLCLQYVRVDSRARLWLRSAVRDLTGRAAAKQDCASRDRCSGAPKACSQREANTHGMPKLTVDGEEGRDRNNIPTPISER